MKSSSQLFPVELIIAEERDHYFEDAYSLKPNNSIDKSVEIALIHLHPKKESNSKQFLFVHDAFNSHWQWLESPYKDIIDDLLASGVSVWLMDWRAHGSSRKNKQSKLNHIEEMAQFDLTAVTDFIAEKRPIPLAVVAIGFGAQMVLMALPYLKNATRYILVNAESAYGLKRFLLPGIKLIKRFSGAGKEWVKGDGPELEPRIFYKMQLRLHGITSLFRRSSRKIIMKALSDCSPKINWICTKKHYVKVAKKHSKAQARIHKIRDAELCSELMRLVSSQSV